MNGEGCARSRDPGCSFRGEGVVVSVLEVGITLPPDQTRTQLLPASPSRELKALVLQARQQDARLLDPLSLQDLAADGLPLEPQGHSHRNPKQPPAFGRDKPAL